MHQGPPETLIPSGPRSAAGLASLAERWDVIVVGAGPAGGLAAREAARRGFSTLLVERESWPRAKVCGSYVSGRAISVLEAVGLEHLVEQAGGRPVNELELFAGGRPARVPLSGRGRMLSRRRLDDDLMRAAEREGAVFLCGTRARLGPLAEATREVELTRGEETRTLRATLILLADGLAGGADPDARDEAHVAPGSRIGLGAYLDVGTPVPDRIRMACAPGGYVGAAQVEDGRLCIAAAVDAHLLCDGPAQAVRGILEHAFALAGDAWLTGVESAAWKGTPPLTRSPRRVAGARFLRLGDAAGYVEPFTGEGIAWALEAALRAGEVVESAVRADDESWALIESAWEHTHGETIAARRGAARGLASLLRRPRATRLLVATLARAPRLGARVLRPVVARLDRPVAAARPTHIT